MKRDIYGNEERACCGLCRWHRHEDIDDGWICTNDASDYCTEWTEYTDFCGEFEER